MATTIEELKNQLSIAEANYQKSLGFLPILKEVGTKIGGMVEEALPGIKAIRESIQQKSLGPIGNELTEFSKPLVTITPEGTMSIDKERALNMGMGFGMVGDIKAVIPADTALYKLIDAIKNAKPVGEDIVATQSAVRSARVGQASAILEKVPGEKGFIQAKGALAGPLMEKPRFEPLRSQSQEGGKLVKSDIEELVNMIQKAPHLTTFEKINTFDGLNDILNGSIPQPKKLILLEDVFGKDLVDTTLQHRTNLEKWKDIGVNIANLPRAIMSSFDLSFGGRQGIFAAPTYRKEFFDSWIKQFGMFGSEKAYLKTMDEVAQNPNYLLAKDSGVSFTKVGSVLADREERFATNWADKIPILKQSSRAYTGFANKFRMDIFNSLINDAKNIGLEPTENKDLAKSIANFVNSATGRGTLSTKLERAAPALNAFFFSPRLMASRLNLLNPAFYIQADPFVRKEALKTLIGFGGYITTVLTLAKLGGAEVELDPRSADFAKIKIGNTRLDIMGGFQQYIRMGAQLVTGKYVSSVTGKVSTLGEGYKPLTRFDILLRQVESKEAPIFSFITDLLRQQDYRGKPVNFKKEITDRFTPMVMGDLTDIAKDNPNLLPFGLLGIFGTGLQTYKKEKTKSPLGL